MANEFVIKNGFISKGDSIVSGTISGNTLYLQTTPTLNPSATEILARNSSTGEVERTTIGAIISGDTFVTGGTYSEVTDTITLTRNDGASIDITGVTDTFTTGATYDNGTALATFTRNDGNFYTLDLSSIDVNDTFVTGTTFSSNQAILTRNDAVDVLSLSGANDVVLTNPSTNQIVIDVNGLKYFISETSPTGFTLSNGYRWFNTSIASEFVYIDDGDSSQWVQPLIQPGPQGPQGPSGNPYFITTGITTSAETLTTGFTYYGVSYVGDVDLTLPDPTGIDGFNFTIKDEGGNAGTYRIRLIPSVGLIDGNTSVDMANNYMGLYLVARNNNWWII